MKLPTVAVIAFVLAGFTRAELADVTKKDDLTAAFDGAYGAILGVGRDRPLL